MACSHSFHGRVVFHCVYAPRLPNPVLRRWIFRLAPRPGYREGCCYEHRGACAFSNCSFVSCCLVSLWQAPRSAPWCPPHWLCLRKSTLFSKGKKRRLSGHPSGILRASLGRCPPRQNEAPPSQVLSSCCPSPSLPASLSPPTPPAWSTGAAVCLS